MYHMGYVMSGGGCAPALGQSMAEQGDQTSPVHFDWHFFLQKIQHELRDEEGADYAFWAAYDMIGYLYSWVMKTMQLPTPTPYTHDDNWDLSSWASTVTGVLMPLSALASDDSDPRDVPQRMTPWVNALADINVALRMSADWLDTAIELGWEVVPGTRSEEWTLDLIDKLKAVQNVANAVELGIRKGNATAVAAARQHADEIGAGKEGLELVTHNLDRMYNNVESGVKSNVITPIKEAVDEAQKDLTDNIKAWKWGDILKVVVPVGVVGGIAVLLLRKL